MFAEVPDAKVPEGTAQVQLRGCKELRESWLEPRKQQLLGKTIGKTIGKWLEIGVNLGKWLEIGVNLGKWLETGVQICGSIWIPWPFVSWKVEKLEHPTISPLIGDESHQVIRWVSSTRIAYCIRLSLGPLEPKLGKSQRTKSSMGWQLPAARRLCDCDCVQNGSTRERLTGEVSFHEQIRTGNSIDVLT